MIHVKYIYIYILIINIRSITIVFNYCYPSLVLLIFTIIVLITIITIIGIFNDWDMVSIPLSIINLSNLQSHHRRPRDDSNISPARRPAKRSGGISAPRPMRMTEDHYIYICMHACMYVCIIYMYVCMNACMYVCMHACMHGCMYVWMHAMYVCLSVCLYVCMYVCM